MERRRRSSRKHAGVPQQLSARGASKAWHLAMEQAGLREGPAEPSGGWKIAHMTTDRRSSRRTAASPHGRFMDRHATFLLQIGGLYET